jgi:hypothetical protein
MHSNQYSTAATNGSAGRYHACIFLFLHSSPYLPLNHLNFTLANKLHASTPSSNVSTPIHDNSQNSSSSSSTSVEKGDLAASRINEYVTNPEHAHVQHRHASSQQAIRTHTNTMGSYLAAFNDTMNQGGN